MTRHRNSIAVFVLCAAVFIAFWPVLHAGFVNWDDGANLMATAHYRGLGFVLWLQWAFTTFYGGCYQPLSWLSYGFDGALWGSNPLGYHLTNLVLHAANAVLFYFVTLRLLRLGVRREVSEINRCLAAIFAALVFALHPLRVESVAWVTERRDVLSGIFYLAALLFYLRRQLAASWACFLLALLAKATGVALPLVFLILDVYPLRRLPADARQSFAPQFWRAWLEKIPFLILSTVFGVAALLGQNRAGALIALARESAGARLTQSFIGLVFYAAKTAVPIRLSPLYELPRVGAFAPPAVWASVAAVLVFSAVAAALRKKWPAILAAWACYAALVFPVLGIFQAGRQFAADRYSYLPCLAWAVLAGAAALLALEKLGGRGQKFLLAGLGAVVCALGAAARSQAGVWHDSQTLWRRVLLLDPNSETAHVHLGAALAAQGRISEALAEYRTALIISPDDARAHNDLGDALVSHGAIKEAISEYERAIVITPGFAQAHYNLGIALADEKNMKSAAAEYSEAIMLDPDFARARVNLGNILAAQGRTREAAEQYRLALSEDPGLFAAWNNLLYLTRELARKKLPGK